jgi:type II secretory ATPase GspE/PulE/Tfp pilus assembly ATPase PilB-like protein
MVRAGEWEGERAHGCLCLLKLWAGLSTAADPLPQDGRILVEGAGRIRPFRISHLVTVDGESAVLRVLGEEDEVRGLEELGMPPELRGLLLDSVFHDPGLVLFTGPTGSGKTTTLYGLLKRIAAAGLKILTIEDPVEYGIAAAVQSAVNEAAGWTFDAAIRAYLRQDPDVLVLGEMRDRASAEAACRAALTGHSVLATLHAADAESAAARLAAWGIADGTVAEALRLVVNQRLVTDGPGGSRHAVYAWRSGLEGRAPSRPPADRTEPVPPPKPADRTEPVPPTKPADRTEPVPPQF